VDALAGQLRNVLRERVYSDDGRVLGQVVSDLLRERGCTLAIAESCTGGLLSAELTASPGASAFFERAFVTYSDRAKIEELGVDSELLKREGAVSEGVASAMARGARRVACASYGLSITGIAGPTGATPTKPVGLVYVALASESREQTLELQLPGAGRERVRTYAVRMALEMLRRALLDLVPLG
jgi:nicotinamide-nucleotide amidase